MRPRADIAVLGYHDNNVQSALAGGLTAQKLVNLLDLQLNTIDVEVPRVAQRGSRHPRDSRELAKHLGSGTALALNLCLSQKAQT